MPEDTSIRFAGHATHHHEVPHLIYVVTGTAHLTVGRTPVTVTTDEGVWLAAGIPHSAVYDENTSVFGPFLDDHVTPAGGLQVLRRVPQLREAVLSILVSTPRTETEITACRKVLGETLIEVSATLFHLPEPQHTVIRRIAEEARHGASSLDALARRHHLSLRQVQRIFHAETAMTFSHWRTRARLNEAARYLLNGDSLTTAAHRVGYSSSTKLGQALAREGGLTVTALKADPRQAVADAIAAKDRMGTDDRRHA
ncbi:MAG: AraC family transcriptional regulator [Micrococcaceae bacterium]